MPEFVPDYTSDTTVYVQLADFLADEIRAGRPSAGGRLPGENEMVGIYGVSLTTIRRALGVLRERGVVRTVPVKGTFVIGPPPADDGTERSG
ncbi:GntR family transcriptional regulator [Jiangella alba]|uniref:Regulatory protein, gntR family n=1 Tax=Jiangella alba TaxID=561176 RepID=A0A1H5PKC1_9ACTN|nr:GntR family transcriptional regulator [Jiangella alba]SEF14176.1 regulatory protein, gntR family [Jiangella alba]